MANIEIQNLEPFYSLFSKFLCCFPNKIKENDELEIDFYINPQNNTYKYSDIINGIQSFFPSMYILILMRNLLLILYLNCHKRIL